MLNVDVPDEVMSSVTTFASTDERGETEALAASKVKEFLNNLGEFTIRAHVKKIPPKGQWPAKNQVDYFISDEVNRVG
jgi:hypothetical protein